MIIDPKWERKVARRRVVRRHLCGLLGHRRFVWDCGPDVCLWCGTILWATPYRPDPWVDPVQEAKDAAESRPLAGPKGPLP